MALILVIYVWAAALFLSVILTLIGRGGLMDALVKIFKTLFSNVREGFQALADLFVKALQPLPPLRREKKPEPTPRRNVFENNQLEKVKELGDRDWVEDHLGWMKPFCMDTPTLIEWIQRQLETKEETRERHLMLDPSYRIDKMLFEMRHDLDRNDVETTDIMVASQSTPILTLRNASMTTNEARELQETFKAQLMQKDSQGRFIHNRAKYLGWSEDIMVIPDGVDYTLIKTELK